MSNFSNDELSFLSRHGFSEEEVHDGRYETKSQREKEAKRAGRVLILTSAPCRSYGHRIRTRGGHCAQCKPASIGFTARETKSGYVYIAGSLTGRLIKIGVASDMRQRERQLNAERYGGFGDWLVLVYVWVEDCGRIERQVSNAITGDRVHATYWKDGEEQTAKEMIRCPFKAAFRAYTSIVGRLENGQSYLDQWKQYNFESV